MNPSRTDTAVPSVHLSDLGRSRYTDALALQRELQVRRKAGEIADTLLLTEHQPVFTLGRFADGGNLLVPGEMLTARGIDLVHVERGGDITYHGPGQLVAYPILDLRGFGRDVHRYIRGLEETAIRLLAEYGVQGERRKGTPGVWAGTRKIASVGVHISRWVTMHGIAINVDMDLSPFALINPCGLAGMEMTSIAQELARPIPLTEAEARYPGIFGEVFGCSVA
jgi:lipoate-protein ligase B